LPSEIRPSCREIECENAAEFFFEIGAQRTAPVGFGFRSDSQPAIEFGEKLAGMKMLCARR